MFRNILKLIKQNLIFKNTKFKFVYKKIPFVSTILHAKIYFIN